MRLIKVLLPSVAIVALAALVAPFGWQLMTGDYFMTVTGKSMQPTYQVGDVLVVQRPSGDELERVGQVVVVAATAGDKSSQYVHRVKAVSADGAILRGDGNAVDDPSAVTANQLMGTPRMVLPGPWGDLYRFTQNLWFRIAIACLVLAALILPARRPRPSETQ